MRLRQLALGTLCMVLVSNLQYAWTLFVLPIHNAHGWSTAAVQVTFTVFILVQTWMVPFEGHLIDRYGPRALSLVGGACAGLSWIIYGASASMPMLYAGAVVGGVGAGIIASAAYGNALKWSDKLRGLALGITAAGYGIGPALTVGLIRSMIGTRGYQETFIWWGLGIGGALVVLALFLRAPEAKRQTTGLGSSVTSVLRAPAFWVMYAMFALIAAGGLIATAQLAPIAHDYKVADVPVPLMGLTMSALTLALSLDRIANGISRPLFGWISDFIGREATMFVAFMLEAGGVYALIVYAHDPVAFVVLSGVVFFAWGEIFSLFPTMCTDIFGQENAARNYGMLYTAKGVGALLVPLGSVLAAGGNWTQVLSFVVLCDVAAALMALFLLRPMRLALMQRRSY